jgi:hypothetical protein
MTGTGIISAVLCLTVGHEWEYYGGRCFRPHLRGVCDRCGADMALHIPDQERADP